MRITTLESTKGMTYEEWKASRRKGIGGSDAATVLGLNKWKSAFELYMEKTGEAQAPEAGEAAYWGNVLEDVVAQEFQKRANRKVRRVNKILVHPKHEWMIANIDRRIVGENALLECKTTSAYNASEWKDDQVPAAYIIQAMHYLAVTGADIAYFAALIGGQRFVWKAIERDEELIASIIEQEAEFWHRVEAKEPPPIDGSASAAEFLKRLYPQATSEEKMLDADVDDLLDELAELKEKQKEYDVQIKLRENQVKQLLGTAEKGIAFRHVVSWSNYERTSLDTKRLKLEDPDIYEAYAVTVPQRRFMVKEV